MKNDLLALEEVCWSQIRKKVKEIAPDIFTAIEKISPDKSYKLYRARYSYGSMIMREDGTFSVPQDGKLLSIADPSVPSILRDQIGYSHFAMPLSLILSGQVQLYTEEKNTKVETEAIYQTGSMLAVRGLLDEGLSYHAKRIWQMTAGARTPIMLPSIADGPSFARLKKYFNLRSVKPKTVKEQWKLFTELANHPSFTSPWATELLVFSKKWLTQEDGDWQSFRLALFKRSWKATEYARNISAVNRIWESLIPSVWRNDKVNLLVFNMVRHIIECCLGQAIVYVPEDGQDLSGPFTTISQIILDIYGLKKYAPIIMSPHIFNPKAHRPTYISLQYIDTYWMNLLHYKPESLIADAREIQYRLRQCIDHIAKGEVKVENTPFSILPDYSFSFYHADEDLYKELLPSENIFLGDKAIEQWQKTPKNASIPHRSAFLRSCIRMQKEK